MDRHLSHNIEKALYPHTYTIYLFAQNAGLHYTTTWLERKRL